MFDCTGLDAAHGAPDLGQGPQPVRARGGHAREAAAPPQTPRTQEAHHGHGALGAPARGAAQEVQEARRGALGGSAPAIAIGYWAHYPLLG